MSRRRKLGVSRGTDGSNPASSSKGSATNLTGKIEPALVRNRRFESSSLRQRVCGRVARQIVEGGFTPRYDYALQTLNEVPYDKWREFDAEDTMRFYALRLHEIGMIKPGPQKIIAESTDWRFFNELKRELRA